MFQNEKWMKIRSEWLSWSMFSLILRKMLIYDTVTLQWFFFSHNISFPIRKQSRKIQQIRLQCTFYTVEVRFHNLYGKYIKNNRNIKFVRHTVMVFCILLYILQRMLWVVCLSICRFVVGQSIGLLVCLSLKATNGLLIQWENLALLYGL